MKPAALAIAGCLCLLVASVSGYLLPFALFALPILLLLAIAAGFYWGGYRERTFRIPMSAPQERAAASPVAVTIRIEGREFRTDDLPPALDFRIGVRNMPMLAAITILLVACVLVFVVTPSALRPMPLDSGRYFLYYVFCYVLLMVFVPMVGAWVSECSLLRSPGITLAEVQPQQREILRSVSIGYHFVDPNGGYHGGTTINYGGPPADNLKIVFCSLFAPDVNKLSCGLLFHRIGWNDIQDS